MKFERNAANLELLTEAPRENLGKEDQCGGSRARHPEQG